MARISRSQSVAVRTSRDQPTGFQIAVAGLDTGRRTGFQIAPDHSALDRMAQEIGAIRITKLRFTGRIQPESRNEWRLYGELRATVTQRCVVSLEPVNCRITAQVFRRFLNDPRVLSPGKDGEMPTDDSIERLTDTIDLIDIARETLLLELPDYPRKASLGPVVWTSDGGVRAIEDKIREKPFAVLRQLKARSGSR